MHEWAVAEAIVLSVLDEAKKNGIRSLERIVIKVGELQKMEKELLYDAIEAIFEEHGYRVKRDQVLIEDEPAVFKCNFCGNKWPYLVDFMPEEEKEYIHFFPEVAHGFLRCPSCGSPDFEIEKGRGVLIESISGQSC